MGIGHSDDAKAVLAVARRTKAERSTMGGKAVLSVKEVVVGEIFRIRPGVFCPGQIPHIFVSYGLRETRLFEINLLSIIYGMSFISATWWYFPGMTD